MSSSLASTSTSTNTVAPGALVVRTDDDPAMSPHPPTTGTSPLTVRYPFPIKYYQEREAVVFNLDRQPLGLVGLPGSAFNVPVRIDILHRAVRYLRAKWQQGTHKAKDRTEVRGGGRKPWPQKKTGRARQGSIRSPLWKGGGVVHGPRPRSHAHKLPLATRLLAMKCALSAKINEGRFFVVDDLLTIRSSTSSSSSDGDAARAPGASWPPPGGWAPWARPISGGIPAVSSGAGEYPITHYTGLKDRLALLTEGSYGDTWLLVDSGEAGADGGLRLRKLLKSSTLIHAVSAVELNVYDVLKYHRLVVTRGALEQLQAALTRPHRVSKPVKHAWWERRKAALEAAVQELNAAADS